MRFRSRRAYNPWDGPIPTGPVFIAVASASTLVIGFELVWLLIEFWGRG